ncbi:MAG: signal recognition particle-docking protein FtsY, partial [Pseudomonadota bacterium]|nr:signal recognition particle-docking protein FtsY [Pseudomonadota bacterium]
VKRLDAQAPHEVILVLDGGVGQNALSQVKLFKETIPLTGLVVTKLDGTAKAGVLFALASQSLGAQRIPVRFIGVGEGIEDLRAFEAEAFVSALLQADES